LASRGAKLSLADISDESLQRTKRDIESQYNTDVIAIKIDVRNYQEVESWISETVKHFGRLDGAANIAGVIPKSIGVATIAEQDLDDWNFLFSVSSSSRWVGSIITSNFIIKLILQPLGIGWLRREML
jgi:NADP-dependent 3-hydroxy acid dehydrogenase YdfG